MQSIAIPWLLVWVLLSASLAFGGLAVLLKGLYPKPIGMAPHCPKCGYNLTGVASEICPECGAARRETLCSRCKREFGDSAVEVCPHCGGPRVMDTAVCGEYRRSRRQIVAAAILILLGITSAGGVYRAMPRARPAPASVSNYIRNAKMMLSDLRRTCAAGQARLPHAGGERDNRMGIVAWIIQEKLPYIMPRRISNTAVLQAATTQLSAAIQLIETRLIPAYNQAVQSGKPEDAKALVPLLDQLDKQLDALLKTVQGY
jgi:hypothetical protein